MLPISHSQEAHFKTVGDAQQYTYTYIHISNYYYYYYYHYYEKYYTYTIPALGLRAHDTPIRNPSTKQSKITGTINPTYIYDKYSIYTLLVYARMYVYMRMICVRYTVDK